MKSLGSYIMEKDDNKEQRIRERINKNNEGLDKATAQLEKTKAKFDKLIDSYKNNKDLCDFVPFDIFNNFQYVSWKDIKALEEKLGKKTNFPYNPLAGEAYYAKAKDHKNKDIEDKFYWDYFTVANDLIEKMHSLEVRINEYNDKLEKLAKNIAEVDYNEDLVNKLFDQVPQLKAFINTVAEKQKEFLIEKSEKLKKALEKWDKEWEKWKEDNKNTKYKSFSDRYWAEENFKKEHKPKGVVLTESQINDMVDGWKKSESLMLATRITTEFGDVESTNLSVGPDGNVNGIIKGTLKTAKIETIWAGGYNIQCLHTRLLIHEK